MYCLKNLTSYIQLYYLGCLLSIYLSTALQFLLDLGHFFTFLILYTFRRTPWTGDQPVARPLPTCRTTQTQNKRTRTSIPQVGVEPTITAFERAKTVHVLECAAHCSRAGCLIRDLCDHYVCCHEDRIFKGHN
jgi:hypothetical protein